MEQVKQKVLGYDHNISPIIVPVGLPYHARSCSLRGSQMAKTDDHFPPLVVCIEPSRTIKASQ